MGNKKRWHTAGMMVMLGLLMAFYVVLPVKAEGVAKSFTGDTEFDFDKGIISKYKGSDKEVVVPAKINGDPVIKLSGTFYNNANVQKIWIPDTIEEFGDNTFNGCTGLDAVCVYDTAVGKTEAELTADSSQPPVWSGYVKDGTAYYPIIDKGNCVVIPRNMKVLSSNALNFVRFECFYVMEKNKNFKVTDEGRNSDKLEDEAGACLLSSNGTKLYKLAPEYGPGQGSAGKYELPVGITEILPYAICNTSIERIVVPNTVTQIDEYAFYKGKNLLEIIFSESSKVAVIKRYAFADNNNLDIVLPSSVTKIEEYCFANIMNRTPDISHTSITVLPAYVFNGCINLHTITMPATLREIRGYAFAGNDNLNEVIFLGKTLDKIEKGAFQDCQNLHKIEIPEGVKAIEDDTFAGCTNLNTVVLPDSLESLGDNSFGGCQNIHEMVIPENVKHISKDTFKGVPPEKLSDIDTSKNAYSQTMIKKALPKKNTSSTVGKLEYKVTKSHASKGTVTVVKPTSKKLKSITIPKTVYINGYVFKVTAISNKAFKDNKKLKSVTIGANVKTIGKEAFRNCKVLKKITVKSKAVTKVNKNAFKGIHKKAKIKLPKMSSKKFKKYKKKFMKKGQAKSVKITK